MIRVILFFAFIGLAAFGLGWLAENPGGVTLVWGAKQYDVSLITGFGVVLALAIIIAFLWGIIRFVFRLPSLMSLAAKARRREKGLNALTRGMLAVGAGDARAAGKHTAEAHRLLAHEPLTKLLRAQSAQLAGDRAGAVKAFNEMLDDDRAHTLGLRGLHVEAMRSGDHDAALDFAARAHKRGALPWAGQAVLDQRAARGDWAGALGAVEANAAARLIDKPAANRLRAVLKTTMAGEMGPGDSKPALALALEACRLAPGLTPAAALAGKLSAASGDVKRAAKIVEAAYAQTPHPDLARLYLHLRAGDAAGDRLARARALARLAPSNAESLLTVGRAALEARDFNAARAAIAPLLESATARPSRRACLLMADIFEAQGDQGAQREWLARAARAPRDPAWVADGVISDAWSPVSPAGKIDAFVWKVPDERLSGPALEAQAPIVEAMAAPPLKIIGPPPESAPQPETAPPPESPPAAEPTPSAAVIELPRLPPAPAPLGAQRAAEVFGMATPMAPDDPGPHDEPAPKRSFRLFSNGRD